MQWWYFSSKKNWMLTVFVVIYSAYSHYQEAVGWALKCTDATHDASLLGSLFVHLSGTQNYWFDFLIGQLHTLVLSCSLI